MLPKSVLHRKKLDGKDIYYELKKEKLFLANIHCIKAYFSRLASGDGNMEAYIYTDESQLNRLYTIIMCIFLYISNTSVKLTECTDTLMHSNNQRIHYGPIRHQQPLKTITIF